jgi:hypothetical protein
MGPFTHDRRDNVLRKHSGKVEEIDERFYDKRYLRLVEHVISIDLGTLELSGIDGSAATRIAEERRTISGEAYRRILDTPSILQGTTLVSYARIYPTGVCVIRAQIDLPEELDADQLVGLTNAIADFDAPLLTTGQERVSLRDIFKRHIRLLTQGEELAGFAFDIYSIIVPGCLLPDWNDAKRYYDPKYELELFAVSVRRVENWRNLDVDMPRRTQRSISPYLSDLVIPNFHNALVYARSELPTDFFIVGIETIRASRHLMQEFDFAINSRLKKLTQIPRSRKELEEMLQETENLRIRSAAALEEFRMLSASAATRTTIMLQALTETFGLDTMVNSLRSKIEDLDSLLVSQYGILAQKEAERASNFLQWLLVVLTLILVVITIPSSSELVTVIRSILPFPYDLLVIPSLLIAGVALALLVIRKRTVRSA